MIETQKFMTAFLNFYPQYSQDTQQVTNILIRKKAGDSNTQPFNVSISDAYCTSDMNVYCSINSTLK